ALLTTTSTILTIISCSSTAAFVLEIDSIAAVLVFLLLQLPSHLVCLQQFGCLPVSVSHLAPTPPVHRQCGCFQALPS
ncbi:uncharacterized protein B0I36DRAFT_280797, partial [Microdochium trichocladiopsis]